jgi:hypothetical protein
MVKVKETLCGNFSLETLEESYKNFLTFETEKITDPLDEFWRNSFFTVLINSRLYDSFYCKDFNMYFLKNKKFNYVFIVTEDDVFPLRSNYDQLLIKDIIT